MLCKSIFLQQRETKLMPDINFSGSISKIHLLDLLGYIKHQKCQKEQFQPKNVEKIYVTIFSGQQS